MQITGRKIIMVVMFCSAIGVGCAKVNTAVTPSGTGGTGFNPDAGPVDLSRPIYDGMTISDAILTTCGNGRMDLSEGCDDGNKVGGDGCTPLCQIESDYECPTVGQACVNTARCGDAKVSSLETCDDGNMTAGDGCSADCKTIETGWLCRVPGKACSPLCGDGVLTGLPPKNETCDDRNTTSGDGCSATCQLEPGATCATAGMPCTTAICGNGMMEAGEGCDAGALNGLFFGNATGCSKTCTKEPRCRDGATTRACDVSCGNGNIEGAEACDDGNQKDGDGCSSKCVVEGGFTCGGEMKPDTVPCTQPGNAGQCLQLPIIYRDFKNESVAGGHPDFFYLGAPVANPVSISGVQGQAGAVSFNKRYCVPNSSGPAKKNDSVNRCWDIAAPTLDMNGKPTFNMARAGGTNCDCQFIDWSHDGNGNHVPGYTQVANGPTNGLTYTDGASGHPMYRGPAPIVTSAASFGQWWVDGPPTGGTHTVGTLEMAPMGTLFQFSSQVNSVTGGFFPLDPPGQFPLYGPAPAGPGAIRMVGMGAAAEQLLCNLWPYWYSSAAFGAGAGCKGDQYLFPPSLLAPDTALMNPNGKWYGAATTPALPSGWFHDSWFTDEVRYLFVHNGAFSLQFYGDDDMFIYINGKLVIDLGGVHQRLPGRVDVSATGLATITEGGSLNVAGTMILPCPSPDPYTMLTMNAATNADGFGHSNCTIATCDCRTRMVDLGLVAGSTYEIVVFGADRHPTESNYQLTLSGFTTNKSNCQPRCGDSVVTGAEECDNGAMNSDTMYGGCTTMCKYGPYCGDGMLNAPEEQCDLGRTMPPPAGNGATYGGRNGCTFGCTFPHYCGDGIVDTAGGEQCDQGETINGVGDAPCQVDCKIKPIG